MRTGVLSDERIIKFLNDNFINTWVPNSELGRIPSLRDPIAKRREREHKTFDMSHTLAQAIIRGWSKYSPVNCMVITHQFELMGVIDYNVFLSNLGGLRHTEAYLLFLKESLEGKRPGLGDITLTVQQPSQEVMDTFRMVTPESYTVFAIDATAFEDGGTLIIDIQIGRGEADGMFYLFHDDRKFPTEKVLDAALWNSQEGEADVAVSDALVKVMCLYADETKQIRHSFNQGQRFKLCATGDEDGWCEEGSVNAFHARISVEENSPKSLAESFTVSTHLSAVLDGAQPSKEILDIFSAPGNGYQDYTVVNINTTAFEDGGVLTVDIRVGSADASGSFDLFDSDTELPTEGIPKEALVSAWGIKPSKSGKISHRFERGTVFRLGATGDWFSEKGSINAFHARISVEAAD